MTFWDEFRDYAEEKWKAITGYENLYSVSNNGRVKSLDRIVDVKCDGNTQRFVKGRFLKQQNRNGYKAVTLSKNGITEQFLVHRLVAMTFLRFPQKDEQVNHLNGNKHDNRLKNLEWVTVSENQTHRFRVLGHEEPTKIAIKCTSLNIESDSIMGLNEKLYELGITSKTSYSVLAKYVREKGRNFKYKNHTFEVIDSNGN